jgi:hypothetical protein
MRTQLSRAAESDLAFAGFEVLTVTDPRTLLDAARGHTLTAVVVPDAMPRGVWRRWRRDPGVGRIPVVAITSGRPPFPLWPLVSLVRAGATVSAADLKRPAAAADAVRASMARGDVISTHRERFGEALWDMASVLKAVGFLLVIPALMGVRTLGLMMSAVALLSAADVLGDVGGRVGLGRRVRLRWSTWVSVIVLLGMAALVVANCGS